MPESKSRHPHKHPHHPAKVTESRPKPQNENRVVIIAIIFFAVIGLVIGFLIDATNMFVLLAGTVVGSVAGYFAGQEFKKSLSGK